MILTLYIYIVCLTVVKELNGDGVGLLGVVVDDIGGGVVLVMDGETGPVGWDRGIESELVAMFVHAEDILDTCLISPRGGASVPSPATSAGMLGIGVDVGGDAIGLDFVFENIGKGTGTVYGVDDRV